MWYDAFICMNHVGDTLNPHARHDASIFKNHVCGTSDPTGYLCDTSRPCVRNVASMCATRLIHVGNTSHPQWIMCVRVDTSHPCVIKWIMCVRHVSPNESCVRHVSLTHVCDTTHQYVWIMSATRPIHVSSNATCVCDTSHPMNHWIIVYDTSHLCVRIYVYVYDT